VDGLVLATGHDGSGVNLAPVSARIVADLVAGSTPEFPVESLDPRRFGVS
jgi:glycine/D-amino acid oxidase-like deaminating enzyme